MGSEGLRLTPRSLCERPATNGICSQQTPSTDDHGTTQIGGGFDSGTIYTLDMGLGPFITFVHSSGKIGARVQILGQGLTGTTSVTFNGIPAKTFTVVTDTYMTAVVPDGATTGSVTVTTPGGSLTSNRNFTVLR